MAENTARRWHRSRAARATVARVCTSEKHWAVSFGSSHASASDKKGETLVVALSKFYFRKLNLSRESNKLRQNFLFSFDWLLHFISMLINLIFSALQRRQCCCHRNSRRVDVRTIRQTSGGTSNCDTQTRTSTIGITSEFISFVFKSDKSSLGWKGKEEESWRELFGPSQSRMWFKSIPSCFLIQSCFGSCTLSSDFPLFVWGWEEHQVWKIFYFEPPCISTKVFDVADNNWHIILCFLLVFMSRGKLFVSMPHPPPHSSFVVEELFMIFSIFFLPTPGQILHRVWGD